MSQSLTTSSAERLYQMKQYFQSVIKTHVFDILHIKVRVRHQIGKSREIKSISTKCLKGLELQRSAELSTAHNSYD